ncbi:MAG: helix-turn-helix domain-containing protein [Firmicutes bacterium]|nr:helix-turn-helix domain-containing protein [Bacillota bacterium]
MNFFSDNFKKLRIEAGKSQLELAKEFNCSQRRISHLECGTIVPDINALIEIAKYFEITIDELVMYKY